MHRNKLFPLLPQKLLQISMLENSALNQVLPGPVQSEHKRPTFRSVASDMPALFREADGCLLRVQHGAASPKWSHSGTAGMGNIAVSVNGITQLHS